LLFLIFSSSAFNTSHGLAGNKINAIVERRNGNLLFATRENGVFTYKDEKFFKYPIKGLENLQIIPMYEDKEKSLWIGTESSGIKRLKDSKFLCYEPLREHQEEIFFSLFENQKGDTWIGVHGGKLFRCRGNDLIEAVEIPGIPGTTIFSIADDAAGNLWLGTNGKGIFQKKDSTYVQFTTREGLTDNVVFSITRDKPGNLWLSTFDGVSIIRHNNNVIDSFKSKNGLLGKRVHNVYEDKKGGIWIATDKGITVLKDGQTAKKNIDYYLKDIPVTCIYEDPKVSADGAGVYWIATEGYGLKRLKDGTITSYTTAQGMTTDFIYRFLADQRDNFWFMSDSGILRVNKNELERFADGKVDTINCTSFGISDGLKSLEFYNKYSRHSALETGNGEFCFITKKGIAIMNPEKIQINKVPPPVVIEAAFFNGQSIPLHRDAEAKAFQNITGIRFHFTAPTFLSPGKVKFKYRLEGVDSEWVSLASGKEGVVFYKDLDPGAYTFKVIACNSDGVWNRIGDSMSFTLKPLFYETILFKTTVFFILIVIAAGFYVYKKRPFKKPPVEDQSFEEQSFEKESLEEREKYKGSPLNQQFANECITKLKYLMEIEKVYRDADLSLRSLAEKMLITSHQLSRILNEKLNRSFADFINYYRIEEAKKILVDPKWARQNIEAVAIEVGYNTRVAFYRAFKNHTQMTPNQYKEKAGNKK
jgi:ligand-binding sensor domain-containing protein/AraC-like DNA-binding protein